MNILSRIPWGYYGVWLLPLGGLMGFAGYGAVLYTYPVFFPVIIKELGWSAAVAATASSLARLEGGIEGPLVGVILDKYGPRVVMLVGGIMMGLGLIAMKWMDSVLYYYIVFGVIVNLGYNVALYTSSYKAVADWWVKWRARAISIMILPTALAGTFGPSVGAWAILQFGWRDAIMYLGILVLVIFIPAALLVRPKRPEAYGLLPDGDDPKKVLAKARETAVDEKAAEKALAQATMEKEVDWTTKEAMKSLIFWVYTIASTVVAFGAGVIVMFVPAHLTARGMDMPTAAGFAGLMLACTYIGRLTIMAIGDVWSKKWMLIFSWFLSAGGAISLANASADAPILAYGYALLYGIGYGMWIPLTPAVRGWLFGRASFGTIYGIINTITMAGSLIAPTFAGWIFDTTSTYYWAYTAFGIAFAAGAVIFMVAKRPAAKAIPTMATS